MGARCQFCWKHAMWKVSIVESWLDDEVRTYTCCGVHRQQLLSLEGVIFVGIQTTYERRAEPRPYVVA